MNRRVRAGALGALVLASLFGAQAAGPASARAADTTTDQLRDTIRTTYELQPQRHTVHVTMDLTLTNKAPSTTRSHSCTQIGFDPYYGYYTYTTTCTVRTSYYYYGYSAWIERDATGLAVKADSGSASVKYGGRKGSYRLANITFSNLNYGKTRHLTVTYDLPSGGPRSTADRRAGSGYASFCAAGPGSETGSVRILVPAGFVGTPDRPMTMRTIGSLHEFAIAAMRKPWTFYTCFHASNDAADITTTIPGAGGSDVTVQAWKDDPDWNEAALAAARSVAKLTALLGPLPAGLPLTIQEHAATAGADLYSSATGVLRLGEGTATADAATHRVAQLWFDERLFASLWMRDGYADWAVLTAGAGTPACTKPGPVPGGRDPALDQAHVLPPTATAQDRDLAAWNRQAGCFIVKSIADAIGPERMLQTIETLRGNESAFGSTDASVKRTAARDWQDWLDIVEQGGLAPAGADIDLAASLARQYGVTHDDAVLATHRAVTAAVAALRQRLGAIPPTIAGSLDTWSFDHTSAALATATKALDAADATAAALPQLAGASSTTRDAVSAAKTQADLDAAADRAARQQAIATDVAAAFDLQRQPLDAIQQLGLMGTPLPGEAAGLDAVAKVDAEAAAATIGQIRSLLGAAHDTGVQRLTLIAGAVVAALAVLIVGGLLLRRRRRRRRVAVAPTSPSMDLPLEP